jgi:hypothetical protein
MAQAKGIRQVAWFDCPGGGQVVVERGMAYIGHMRNPHGTSIVDVGDPRHPRLMAQIEVPRGVHSHKVRVGNGLMLVNHEFLNARVARGEQAPAGFRGGLAIYDIAAPDSPRLVSKWEVSGAPGPSSGIHRFDFDGRYAYLSPTMDGYGGNIVLILDLADPAKPVEVGRWWMPGQWTAGGETPSWTGWAHRCHHPLRFGDRLYTSYWHGGFVILDIADMAKPKYVSGLDWSPPCPWPTHSAVRVPFRLGGRDLLLVSDEDVFRLEGCQPYNAAFLWLVDITDERHPVPFSSFQLEHMPVEPQPFMTGCHQPVEKIAGPEVPVAWFAHGLRIVDIARPHAMRGAAYFLPDPPPGAERVQANDVYVDERGLMYLIDRVRGLHILERV